MQDINKNELVLKVCIILLKSEKINITIEISQIT